MKRPAAIGAALLTAFVLFLGGAYFWANSAMNVRLTAPYSPHTIDIPVPTPLTEAEIKVLRTEGVDLDAIALKRAIARGKHLVNARYVCVECHGKDFSGGVMVDDGAMGTWLGPNLTQGKGSKVIGHTIADWDRIVRHGVKKDGTAAIMPSVDFVDMSDRELSDIVAYIGTFASIDNEVPAPIFGPIGTLLMATGKLPLSAEHHAEGTDHIAVPPATEPTATFGKHLVQVCTGCHRADLTGGPIQIGPPDWPPARNLTPHADGLGDYSFEQFQALMADGTKADGSELLNPMTLMAPYTNRMTEVEVQALWAYLQSVDAKPTGT